MMIYCIKYLLVIWNQVSHKHSRSWCLVLRFKLLYCSKEGWKVIISELLQIKLIVTKWYAYIWLWTSFIYLPWIFCTYLFFTTYLSLWRKLKKKKLLFLCGNIHIWFDKFWIKSNYCLMDLFTEKLLGRNYPFSMFL